MTIRSSLIFAACLLLPTLANAVNVPLADGMCALDAKVPEESVVITYLRSANVGSNQVLAIFAPCDELDALAKKKINGLTRYGSVLNQELSEKIPMDRTTYLGAVASAYQQSVAQLDKAALQESSAAVQRGASASNLAKTPNVNAADKGIIYQDPSMLMIGMEQTNTSSGTPVKVASTTSMTLVGGSPVSVNYYEPLSEDADFSKSKDVLMRYTNQIIRANP